MTVRLLAIAGCLMIGCATAGKDQPGTSTDAPITNQDGPTVDIDANNCANQPCDILTQCGCPGKACDVDITDFDGPACRDVTTANAEGQACSSLATCGPGLVCLGGFCKKYCDANTDCAAPRGQCVIDIVSGPNNTEIPNIPDVCSSGCDPASSATGGFCAPGAKCGIFTQTHNGTDFDIADCTTAGAGAQGAACITNNAGDDSKCAADFLCTTNNIDTSPKCRHVCIVGGAACSGGLTCLGFNPALVIGGTTYGACN